MSVHIRRTYPSVTNFMKVAPGKMRAIFTNIEHANAMPTDAWFKGFKVYIPAELVETTGVIEYPIGEDLSELVKSGKGKFLNPD